MNKEKTNMVIHKRTFEGINDNVITSKYMTSFKWAVSYDQYGIAQSPKLFVTRKCAETWIDSIT